MMMNRLTIIRMEQLDTIYHRLRHAIVNRNYSAILATLQGNRQTSGEFASLPQQFGTKTVRHQDISAPRKFGIRTNRHRIFFQTNVITFFKIKSTKV
jgi:hypothetical protein